MNFTIPDPSLVLLIGASGSGKSTFAKHHFRPTEIVSSDACRAWISDDEGNQSVTPEAFALLRHIVSLRLRNRRITVVDATNVQRRARVPLLALAQEHNIPAIAIVFHPSEAVCLHNNTQRPGRSVPEPVILQQREDLQISLVQLPHEGFGAIHILENSSGAGDVTISRTSHVDYKLEAVGLSKQPRRGLWRAVCRLWNSA